MDVVERLHFGLLELENRLHFGLLELENTHSCFVQIERQGLVHHVICSGQWHRHFHQLIRRNGMTDEEEHGGHVQGDLLGRGGRGGGEKQRPGKLII